MSSPQKKNQLRYLWQIINKSSVQDFYERIPNLSLTFNRGYNRALAQRAC
jgi:hypothetical protein